MANLVQEQTLQTVPVDLVVAPWAEQTSPEPVVHTPLDDSPAWVALVPTPPQQPTMQLMVHTEGQLLDAIAVLRHPGSFRVLDLDAPAGWRRFVLRDLQVRQELPTWVLTVAAIEVL